MRRGIPLSELIKTALNLPRRQLIEGTEGLNEMLKVAELSDIPFIVNRAGVSARDEGVKGSTVFHRGPIKNTTIGLKVSAAYDRARGCA